MLKLSTDLFCYWLGFVDSAQSYRAIALTCTRLAHGCSLLSAHAKNRFCLRTSKGELHCEPRFLIETYVEIAPQLRMYDRPFGLECCYPFLEIPVLPSGLPHGLVTFHLCCDSRVTVQMDTGRQVGPTTYHYLNKYKAVLNPPIQLSSSHFIACVSHYGETADEYVQHKFEVNDSLILRNELLCKHGTFTGALINVELRKLGWYYSFDGRRATFRFSRSEEGAVRYSLVTYARSFVRLEPCKND